MKKPSLIEMALDAQLNALMASTSAKQVEVATQVVPGLKIIRYRNGRDAWVLRYKDPLTGKRAVVIVGDPATMSYGEAISCALKMIATLKAGKSLKGTSLTLEAYFDFKFHPWALKTKRSAHSYLSHFDLYYRLALGNKRLSEISFFNLVALVDALPDHLALATKNKIAATGKSIFRRAADDGLIDINPAARLKLKPEHNARQRVLVPLEIRVVSGPVEFEINPLPRLFNRFVLSTAVRLSEALTAKFADIDLTTRFLHLKNTKNGKPHAVPLSEEALSVIKALAAIRRNEYLFPGRFGGHMTRPSAALKRMQEKGGVKGFCYHDMRRTACSIAINAGVPLLDASRLLGHSNTTVTQTHYAVLHADRLHAAAETISDVLRAAMEST